MYLVDTPERRLKDLIQMLNEKKPFAQAAEFVDKGFTVPELQKLLGDQKFRQTFENYLLVAGRGDKPIMEKSREIQNAMAILRKEYDEGDVAKYLDNHIPLKMAMLLYRTSDAFRQAWNGYYVEPADANVREKRLRELVLQQRELTDYGKFLWDTGKMLTKGETWEAVGKHIAQWWDGTWNDKTPWWKSTGYTAGRGFWEATNLALPMRSFWYSFAESLEEREARNDPTPAKVWLATETYKGRFTDAALGWLIIGKAAKAQVVGARAALSAAGSAETMARQVDRTVTEMSIEMGKRGMKGEELKNARTALWESGKQIKNRLATDAREGSRLRRAQLAAAEEIWKYLSTPQRFRKMLQQLTDDIPKMDDATRLQVLEAYQLQVMAEMSPKHLQRLAQEAAEAAEKEGAKATGREALEANMKTVLEGLGDAQKELKGLQDAGKPSAEVEARIAFLQADRDAIQTAMSRAAAAEHGAAGPWVVQKAGWLAQMAAGAAGRLGPKAMAQAQKTRGLLERLYGTRPVARFIELWGERNRLSSQLAKADITTAEGQQTAMRHAQISAELAQTALVFETAIGLGADVVRLGRWGAKLPFRIPYAMARANPDMQLLLSPVFFYYLKRTVGYGTQHLATEIGPETVPRLRFRFKSLQELREATLGRARPPSPVITGKTIPWLIHSIYQAAGRMAQDWFKENVAEGKEMQLLDQLAKEDQRLDGLMLSDSLQAIYAGRGLLKAPKKVEEVITEEAAEKTREKKPAEAKPRRTRHGRGRRRGRIPNL